MMQRMAYMSNKSKRVNQLCCFIIYIFIYLCVYMISSLLYYLRWHVVEARSYSYFDWLTR